MRPFKLAEWGGGTARKLARSDVSIREFDAQLAVDSVWLLDTITGKEKRRGEKNQEKKSFLVQSNISSMTRQSV